MSYYEQNQYDDSETQDVGGEYHQQYDDSETQDVGCEYHQQYDDSETQDVGGEIQPQNAVVEKSKKCRGPNQKNWAMEGWERLIWNRHGQPMGPRLKVARFSRFLGIMAKDFTLFPISEKDFRNFNKSDNHERAWQRVKNTIDWRNSWVASLEDKIKKVVRAKLNERWKHWKSHLHLKYYKPVMNSPCRFEKPDDDRIDDGQWKIFVKNMDDKKHQNNVRINKRNRSQKKMNQTTGTRTYANVAHEYQIQYGKEPDRWELFKLTHQRKGTQEPIDAATAKAIADYEEAEQKRLSMNIDITLPEIREEIYAEVLGNEKGNRVRGFGAGVSWDDVPGIHVEQSGVSREVQLLRDQLETQTKEAQEREARMMEEFQSKMVEHRKRMEEIFEVRCTEFALKKLGEMLKQCGIPTDTQDNSMRTISQLPHDMSQMQLALENENVYRPTLPAECTNMQMDRFGIMEQEE